MKLARTIHFDESDQRVFHNYAQTGEWCTLADLNFPIGVKPIWMGKPDKLFKRLAWDAKLWAGCICCRDTDRGQ